ncbi:unnamed protein product, partial [Polarella glacialis]
ASLEDTCTGNSVLPPGVPVCFAGSRFGLTLFTTFVNGDTNTSGILAFNVSWGLVNADCSNVSFSQTNQTLAVDKMPLQDCLPNIVQLDHINFCPDQGQVVILFDKPLFISVSLDQVDCDTPPSLGRGFLLPSGPSSGSEVQSVAQRHYGGQALGMKTTSTEQCTGSAAMPPDASLCFEGLRLGLTLKAKFVTGASSSGKVDFEVSGLVSAKCVEIPFSPIGQSMHVNPSLLDKCLPDVVGLADVKFCSDQKEVMLEFSRPMAISVNLQKARCTNF